MIKLTEGDVINILILFVASIGSVYFLKNPKVSKINFSNFNKDPNILDDSVNPEQDSDQENNNSEILEVAENEKVNTTNQSDEEISKISLETILKEGLPVFLCLLVMYLLYKYFSAHPLTDYLFSL